MNALKELLDKKVEFYNRTEFIESDPVQIPHLFKNKEDIEIAGFFAATLSWGQRKTIISKTMQLMSLMENHPFEFVLNSSPKDLKRLEGFCHRTFNTTDTLYFIHSLKNIYRNHGGLQKVFEDGFAASRKALDALHYFHTIFFEKEYPLRTCKHVPNVMKGSSAKRLNMYLRWMIRNDDHHVDFGLWKNISPSWLSIPLDLHTGNTSRRLGLLNRKTNDWQAVEELTAKLREFDPADPVKYDYALFGMGVFEKYR